VLTKEGSRSIVVEFESVPGGIHLLWLHILSLMCRCAKFAFPASFALHKPLGDQTCHYVLGRVARREQPERRAYHDIIV
jgi:hypothetical protein